MKECLIYGERIQSWSELYDCFEEELNLPIWFGRNLDALYDCLTELHDTQITIYQWNELERTLGEKGRSLRAVLTDVGIANPGLIVCLLDGNDDEI